MVKLPQYIAADVARLVDTRFLTEWDKKITHALESPNRFLWRNIFGTEKAPSEFVNNTQWNYELGPFEGNHSVWGIEPRNMDILYTPVTNNYVAMEGTLDLDYVKIGQAMLGGIDIIGETVRAIANKLDWMETYYHRAGLTGGTDNPVTMTGILGFTGIQDAGNPTGAWDDPTDVHVDIITILGKLDAIGYDGPIDLVMDSALKAGFRGFIDDGATTFETLVSEWIKSQLNGGRIFFSEYAFVAPSTQYTGVSYTGVTAGTNHICMAIGRHPANKIKIAHDVKPFERNPYRQGDVLRDYISRTTVKIGSPLHIVYMDGIDEST